MFLVILLGFVFLTMSLYGVLIAGPLVTAANTNQSEIFIVSRVNVSNSKPFVLNVVIEDNDTTIADQVDLVPGDTLTVLCNNTLYDGNGWADVAAGNISGRLHQQSVGYDNSPDNNDMYYNGSCNSSCLQIAGTTKNVSCPCAFDVYYYANNATWTCNVSVIDIGGDTDGEFNLSDWNNDTSFFNAILGINVSGDIDYGDVAATQISGEISKNVSNVGNVPLNFTVAGFSYENRTWNSPNVSMNCTVNSIPNDNQRFSIQSGDAYADMTRLNNESVVTNLSLLQKTDDNELGFEVNATYWRLQVPIDVEGVCNGTVRFTAEEHIGPELIG